MVNYWDVVNEVLRKSDLVVIVLDARYIEYTRNKEIENKIVKSGKLFLYVINKCDLKKGNERVRLNPCVHISAKDHLGTSRLRQKIMSIASHINAETIRVGIVGYPNVGKSSVINALKGRASAKVSSTSGYTQNKQNVRVSKRLMLIDTPGVIPYMEKDIYKHTIIGIINADSVKDPDMVIYDIMEHHPELIEKKYNVSVLEDKEKTLEKIARKKGMLSKGAVPDIDRTARMIIHELQK